MAEALWNLEATLNYTYCDAGHSLGPDAAKQIEYQINLRIAVPVGHVYYTDIFPVELTPYEAKITINNGYNNEDIYINLINQNGNSVLAF